MPLIKINSYSWSVHVPVIRCIQTFHHTQNDPDSTFFIRPPQDFCPAVAGRSFLCFGPASPAFWPIYRGARGGSAAPRDHVLSARPKTCTDGPRYVFRQR